MGSAVPVDPGPVDPGPDGALQGAVPVDPEPDGALQGAVPVDPGPDGALRGEMRIDEEVGCNETHAHNGGADRRLRLL